MTFAGVICPKVAWVAGFRGCLRVLPADDQFASGVQFHDVIIRRPSRSIRFDTPMNPATKAVRGRS